MRPLKPYLIAVSGLITALFSAVFLGAHPGPTTAAPVTTPQPDLQSRSVVPGGEVVASRDAKPAEKVPAPRLDSLSADYPESETLRSAPEFGAAMPQPAPGRIVDRRALSLGGIVELRI
jgi:hypothetical protein